MLELNLKLKRKFYQYLLLHDYYGVLSFFNYFSFK